MRDTVWLKSSYLPPECQTQGHRVRYMFMPIDPIIVYQHGDNPEAVLRVDRFSFRTSAAAAQEVKQLVHDWIERVHAYESRLSEDENDG